ncbi:MAG: ABC transporter ATP-binding protein [Lachnospiraceae bacterium]|nr:ABC transporter ATP-binding protein [Lachnospiraceae bacterium]
MRRDTLKKVLHSLRPYRGQAALSFAAAVLTVLSTLYLPILIGDAVDLVIGPSAVNFEGLVPILITMGAVTGVTAVCQWAMNILNNRIVCGVVRDLRVQAFSRIQHLPVAYLDAHPVGDIVSRVVADVDTVADGLLMGFTQLFTGVLTILGTLAFMLSVHVWIALVVILITPLSLFIARYIARKTHRFFEAQSVTRGQQTAMIHETVTNEKVVKAYRQEEQVKAKFAELNETLKDQSMKAVFFSSLVNPTTRFVNALVYAAVGGFGAWAVLGGRGFTVGMLTCFLTYANQYTKPFNEISGVVTELENALVCAERVYSLIEAETETPDRETAEAASALQDAEAAAVPASYAEPAARTARGHVQAEHVYFSYDPAKPLLQDLNIEAKPGEHIAIVGTTGCGKTTFINLLMRFYEIGSGVIRIDGTDIRDMTRAELRSRFGMVLQDTWLSSGTIRENLMTGRPDASEAEMVEAAKACHAHGFIRRLPDGYDTAVGEDGGSLSQGQKQLLCIARVMLADPPMLILDEATSSIDTRTELRVQSAFTKLMEGRTSFIVAHRLSTIKNADRILVMNRGRIEEQGTHEELLARDGLYRHLYESQFKGIAV